MTSQPQDPQSQTPEAAFPGLKDKILGQWRVARPKMVADMEQSGSLERILTDTCNLTIETITRYLQQGVPRQTAWELAQQTWMLPSEDRVPSLANRQETEDERVPLSETYEDQEDEEE